MNCFTPRPLGFTGTGLLVHSPVARKAVCRLAAAHRPPQRWRLCQSAPRPAAVALDRIRFDAQGLVPVVTQDVDSDQVLMLAYMSRASLEETLRSGRAVYYSRSRGELWRKGDTSGQVQHVQDIVLDCDGDAVLLRVRQVGVACHTGRKSCFYRRLSADGQWQETAPVLIDPATLYGRSR
ncbi:hypothetical protein CDCA_CDCA05G1527 [Cyanidium caldarium]|uniref:Histidine biosynthesis bifunctional protein HisIE n=1 Tax=Cyanidium caldarium TaxID=2771 RepID=A0AAV9IT51_CYACA|nr:hypothetical protein CDCA_CDCA05G1527 [Cyanidium caldarium]